MEEMRPENFGPKVSSTAEDERASRPRRQFASPASDPCQRRRSIRNRAEQNERVIPGGTEPRRSQNRAAPSSIVLTISARPPNQSRRVNATFERVLDQTCPDPLPRSPCIRGKLTRQQTRNGIRRLIGAYRTRHGGWRHGSRSQTVVVSDTPRLLDNRNSSESLLLVGEGAHLQPVVKRKLAA